MLLVVCHAAPGGQVVCVADALQQGLLITRQGWLPSSQDSAGQSYLWWEFNKLGFAMTMYGGECQHAEIQLHEADSSQPVLCHACIMHSNIAPPVAPRHHDNPAPRGTHTREFMHKAPLVGHVLAAFQRPDQIEGAVFKGLGQRISHL